MSFHPQAFKKLRPQGITLPTPCQIPAGQLADDLRVLQVLADEATAGSCDGYSGNLKLTRDPKISQKGTVDSFSASLRIPGFLGFLLAFFLLFSSGSYLF